MKLVGIIPPGAPFVLTETAGVHGLALNSLYPVISIGAEEGGELYFLTLDDSGELIWVDGTLVKMRFLRPAPTTEGPGGLGAKQGAPIIDLSKLRGTPS